MKLTAEQIQIVEDTLNLNGLDYDDIKLEVLDHIASEIEEEMSINNQTFEETCKAVFENWNDELKPSLLSRNLYKDYNVPKIVKDKLIEDSRILSKTAVYVPLLLTAIYIFFYEYLYNVSILTQVQSVLATMFLVVSVMLIAAKLIILRSELKTSFKFNFDKGFYILLCFGVLKGFGFQSLVTIRPRVFVTSCSLIFSLCILFAIVGILRNAYQHFQFEKKYAI
jgi:hypothetical protein